MAVIKLQESVRSSLRSAFVSSGRSLSSLADASGKNIKYLSSLLFGSASLSIDDVFMLSRSLHLSPSFSLVDIYSGEEFFPDNEKTLSYSDYSSSAEFRRKYDIFVLMAKSSNNREAKQFSMELKAKDNNQKLRYFIYLKAEKAMHELCMDALELSDILNVSPSYIEALSDGDVNFSLSFLESLSTALSSEIYFRLLPWKSEVEALSIIS